MTPDQQHEIDVWKREVERWRELISDHRQITPFPLPLLRAEARLAYARRRLAEAEAAAAPPRPIEQLQREMKNGFT